MVVLGVSGFEDAGKPPDAKIPIQLFPLSLIGHDPSAALFVDGKLVAAAAEERFTRIKHGLNLAGRPVLPRRAMRYCLDEAGLDWRDVDFWAHYCRFTRENVAARLDRVTRNVSRVQREAVEREYRQAYSNRVDPEVVRSRLEAVAGAPIPRHRFVAVPHHLAHCSGAVFSSGFSEASWLVVDGYGETESATWGTWSEAGVESERSVHLPSSLGVVYQIFSAYLGFREFGDEYKVMGLSAYGNAQRYQRLFDELIELGEGGTFSTEGLARDSLDDWIHDRLGSIRSSGAFSQKAADIAASLQRRVEEALLHIVTDINTRNGLGCLCMSGGVALNACANGAVVRSGQVGRLFVQPAASDDGASVGAAAFALHQLGVPLQRVPRTTYWGPAFGDAAIRRALRRSKGLRWERADDVERTAASLLADDKILGWFQGRMEIGPRALGARSILANPRSTTARDEINARVKGREPFRPFAPSILKQAATDFFELPDETAAPYMVATYRTHDSVRERIPAVVHVDGSARVQTVSQNENPRYHGLLSEFYELTGIPVLLNTSFNRAGEPIVCTPDDAIRCFLKCGIDALVIGDYIAYPENGASKGGES